MSFPILLCHSRFRGNDIENSSHATRLPAARNDDSGSHVTTPVKPRYDNVTNTFFPNILYICRD
ncbi:MULTISPECIES: hypothetical protein [unclassified Rickettsia]|uniref:hypothetical protein n=1 Tax=unclassified Rickettsia TaxID=114295 RepID=UPI003132AA14